MFRKNESYKQKDLFGISNQLSKKQTLLWSKSKEHKFNKEIFQKIDEEIFRCLYSEKKSRPNVGINQMVGSLILKHLKNWTYEDMFTNLNFNLLTRHSIGIETLEENVFSEASIFNFQNRLIEHYNETGEDLLSKTFELLTSAQIKEYNVDTKIQRGDSFLIGSNIVDYSRARLLIEVLLRFEKTLSQEEKDKFSKELEEYTKDTSSQYVYKLKKEELPKKLIELGGIYMRLLDFVGDKYKDEETYENLKRVYGEHFKTDEKDATKIEIKKSGSGSLMSPDDVQATFRKKYGKGHKGYVGHISETVNKNNKVDLITDVVVRQNNEGDELILENRLPIMISQTPDLEEYHVDGAYSSYEVDQIVKKEGIEIYQNNFRGRKSTSGILVESKEDGTYEATCSGGQIVKAILSSKAKKKINGKVYFDYEICETCPFIGSCQLQIIGGKRTKKKKVYYFNEKKLAIHERKIRSNNAPKEKRKIRPNVEASVKEMKRGIKNDKVRVRQWIRISFHMTLTAIAINFTRIAKKNAKIIFLNLRALTNSSSYRIRYNLA